MNPSLNPFEAGQAGAIALFATRMGGLMLIAPVYSARVIPAPIRVAVLIAVTMLMAPLVTARPIAAGITPATMGSELLIGFAMGFGAAIFIGAAEVAGDIIAFQSGLSSASTLDPMTQFTSPVLADFMARTVLTLLVVMGGHLFMLEAVAGSMETLPLGAPIAAADGLYALLGLGGHLFALGVQIAAPVMAAVFVSNLAMGVLARTAPQLQVFMLAYPLQIIVGTVALALALPLLGVTFAGWTEQYRDIAVGLIDTMGTR